MTALTLTSPQNMQGAGSSTAGFRQYFEWYSTTLRSLGTFNRVTSTGQVDLTTAPSSVPATGAVWGWEVFGFADALQSTAPVFFKLEYGMYGGVPAVWYTVSTAHDGAGGMTGQVGTRTMVAHYPVSGSSTSTACYANGGSGRFWFLNFYYTNAGGGIFGIERARDSVGASTGGDIIVWSVSSAGGSTSLSIQSIPRSGTVPVAENSLPALTTNNGASTSITSASDNEVAFFSVTPFSKNRYILPTLVSMMPYINTDVSAMTTINVSIYSNTQVYLPLGNGLQLVNGLCGRPGNGCALALRFD